MALYNCVIDDEPRQRGGKTYVSLDIAEAVGDTDVLRACDQFIWSQARPAYSPAASAPLIVAKVLGTTRYENDLGNPAAAWPLRRGQTVDVVLRPGAFGDFGYCLLLHRIKPRANSGS